MHLCRANWKICYPPFYNTFYGTMHTKFMILYYENVPEFSPSLSQSYPNIEPYKVDAFLRIVIPSANLVPYDYEQVQNIVYIQDFPIWKHAPAGSSSSFKGKQFFVVCTHLLPFIYH